ncbi:MAG TPA: hypothetical protein VNY06_02250 [Methylocella sp.]|nr:hypothetical protein [Methylocella sp.]
MNNEKDSDDYKRTQEIRAILLKDWDPLGIGDNPNLADEYDHYIPAILRLFDTHGTVEELERYLADIEEKWELTPDPAAWRAAKKIFDALKESE